MGSLINVFWGLWTGRRLKIYVLGIPEKSCLYTVGDGVRFCPPCLAHFCSDLLSSVLSSPILSYPA